MRRPLEIQAEEMSMRTIVSLLLKMFLKLEKIVCGSKPCAMSYAVSGTGILL